MGITNQPPDLLPGTLDMLILRTLGRGALHGCTRRSSGCW
jgi:hypothetical protein